MADLFDPSKGLLLRLTKTEDFAIEFTTSEDAIAYDTSLGLPKLKFRGYGPAVLALATDIAGGYRDRCNHFPRVIFDSPLMNDLKSVGLKKIGVVVRKRQLFAERNRICRLAPIMIISHRFDCKENGGTKFARNVGNHFIEPFTAKVFQHAAVRNEQGTRLAIIQQPPATVGLYEFDPRIKVS